MKEIKLTHGFVALLDDEDYDYINQFKWQVTKQGNRKYAVSSQFLNGKWTTVRMHRIIMNTPKGMEIDHIDHDGLNNQKVNLRHCNHGQNQMNKRPYSSTGYKGVYYNNGKISVMFKINGKMKFIGNYENEIEAAKA